LSTNHPEFFAPRFMIDMVPTTPAYEWKLTAQSNAGASEATITWNQDAIAKSESGLMLIDVDAALWVDMKTTRSYTFPWKTGKEFTVAFNKTGEPLTSMTLAGIAYPNPFKDRVTIPILNASENELVTVYVYDLLGRKVRTLSQTLHKKGEYKIIWDGRDDSGNDVASGMLLYRLQYGNSLSKAQRIIKE
ncbi:MAG TPA: T9SS type A sorting domain-containing protein, partial [Cyclobacteriaceae bacterium]